MAYDFDGTNDNLSSAADAVVGIDVTTITMAAWVNHPGTLGTGLEQTLFTTATTLASGGFVYFLNLQESTGIKTEFGANWSTTDGVWLVNAALSANVWHHVAVTYNGSSTLNDPVIYVDGISAAFTETLGPPAVTLVTGGDNVRLGENAAASNDFDGALAEAAIWNRILTAGEIAQLGAAYSPLFVPRGLVQYWPLVRGLNSVVGSGGTLTATGATVFPHPRIIYPSRPNRFRFGATAAGGLSIPVAMHEYRRLRAA